LSGQASRDFASAGLDLWAPTKGEYCNALFWGFAMLSLSLPAAFLAFQKADPDEEMSE
jgi:hypothetical protein